MRISDLSSDVCSSDLLDASHAIERRNRAVEDAQRALDLDGEVDVSGGVDDVQAMLGTLALIGLPQAGGRRGGDGDAAFLFLFHPVHRRGAVMDFADLVGLAGIIEDALGRRGLAGVVVRHETEIAIALERMAACNDILDRKSDRWGKSVSERVDMGGRSLYQ